MKWIPIEYHEEEGREGVILDCEMPKDDQDILISTKGEDVLMDVCYIDDDYHLDSCYDWIQDVVAWMPLPEPYRGKVQNDGQESENVE